MAKEELAKVENNELAAFGGDDNLMDELTDLLGDAGGLAFDTIKVPAGGGKAWEIPTGDPENPDIKQKFNAVVVAVQKTNAYWARSVDEGGDAIPDCSSTDGKTGRNASGECLNCTKCPKNEFGSGNGGVGKACKNKLHLFCLLEGTAYPVKLSIPATSINRFLKEYAAKKLLLKKKSLDCVMTTFGLESAVNGAGTKYSKVTFALDHDLTAEELDLYRENRDMVVNAVAQLKASRAPATNDFAEIDDDERLPFEDI